VLLPVPIALDVPIPASFWIAITFLRGLAFTRASHAWQSRAPPHQLQA
jgi:hypothetical protein